MSISFAEIRQPIPSADRLKEAPAPGCAPRAGAFSHLLASIEESGGATEYPAIPTRAQAELIRLRMMRDALSIPSDEPDAAAAQSAPAVENLLRHIAAYHENSLALTCSADEPGPAPVPEARPAPAAVSGCFATPFDEIIHRASRRYGVESGLIRAVIKAESNFNPGAVSPAGARGLMQLMPGTARDLGVTDSFDPEQNIMAGTRFLKQLLDRYDGDLDSALAAYNWGPGNVDRKGHALPRETRNYLSTVKGYYSSFVG